MTVDTKINELFKSRNEHERRIAIVETDIGYIKREQRAIHSDIKENHKDYMQEMQSLSRIIFKWGGAITAIGFIIMAYLAWKTI